MNRPFCIEKPFWFQFWTENRRLRRWVRTVEQCQRSQENWKKALTNGISKKAIRSVRRSSRWVIDHDEQSSPLTRQNSNTQRVWRHILSVLIKKNQFQSFSVDFITFMICKWTRNFQHEWESNSRNVCAFSYLRMQLRISWQNKNDLHSSSDRCVNQHRWSD